MEWNISSLGTGPVSSASIRLHTIKGTVDAFDTEFYAIRADGNGTLDDSDFEAAASRIGGAVMSVPAVPVGTEGVFVFDVTSWLQQAIEDGFTFFGVQGRVPDELVPFPGHDPRGLQIRSTAAGNIASGLQPALTVQFGGQVVDIDIKPGSSANAINCMARGGVVPVAIITTEQFDATTVDHTTVQFGPERAAESHRTARGVKRHEEDVDGDGDSDLVMHFRFKDTGIACGDGEAVLTGQTHGGLSIWGAAPIRTVPR
jgi:hypothetical protein